MFDFEYKYDSHEIHSIYPYPAKFPPAVPYQLLKRFSKEGDIVFDPFSGSGTTLVEGLLHNCNVIGNDINPIALLISEIKITNYDLNDFKISDKYIDILLHNYEIKKELTNPTYFKNIKHWFQENVRYELDLIKEIIYQINNNKIQKLWKLVFSNIIIEVSNQESDTRYAAINKNLKDRYTIELFIKKYFSIKNILLKWNFKDNLKRKLYSEDSRNIKSIKNDSVDIIITSPPYANTYDYYLYHKHRMNWLGYDVNRTKNIEIGSRNEFSSKKRPIEKWENDIFLFTKEMKRVIKPKKYICIIIGDSVVNKKFFDAYEAYKKIAVDLDLNLIYHTSVSLSKNTKKFNYKFRTKMDKKEHLIILQKEK